MAKIKKTTTFVTPPPTAAEAALRGALNKRKLYLSSFCLIIVILCNTHSVTAAPANFDSLDSTLPLDLQPPVFEATPSASSPPSPSNPKGNADGTTAVDSYGNPIESLQPIQTPDGRKVVSAHGLQFEIPNYASGITELKTPADDLLPPFVDPIVVALPDTSEERFSTYPGQTSEVTTSVDVERVPLVEFRTPPALTHSVLSTHSRGLPKYILELNDPDIAGPVSYQPSEDKRGLNVIAWDLLPPFEVEDLNGKFISHSNRVSVTTGHNFVAQASQESSHTTQRPQYRGGVSFASSTISATTPRIITTPRTTAIARTTTPRTTTTTTRRTTTPRATTTTTTTTTPEPDSSEFFKLEAGDSYTLPPWLLDIDDPELDVAVTFEVPADINEYNITIERDLLPPFEPYTDLNDITLTSPLNYEEFATTTARTTTTTTARSTTTRRPTLTTTKVHWIRAKPTVPPPTVSTFNYQFTRLSPFSSSTNFAQRIVSTRSTTTVKPQTSLDFYNRQLSSTIPQTDKIGSSIEEFNTKSGNPFLSTAFTDGRYKPRPTTRMATTTSTTTTTTTPKPQVVERNPFEATIPPWLKDFDYPGLGPGVPFVYNPDEDENPVDKDILPPSQAEEPNQTNPPLDSPFLNSQTPQSFKNQLTSSATPLTSTTTSSIPSIVTNPLPSTQTNLDDSTLTQPPAVFAPPTSISAEDKSDDFSKQTSSTFNKNFPAPFDSTTTRHVSSGGDQKKVPLSADRESFPPFNSLITGSSTIPTKTTFSKSEDGKVITNNIFLSGGIGATASKPIGSLQFLSSQEKNTLTTQSTAGSSLTTSAAASGFVTASSSFTSDNSKYTGRFGGPAGVLAPQANGFTTSSSTVTKSYTKPFQTTFGVTLQPTYTATYNNDKFTGSFGGPPGILRPYDNVKNR